MTIRLERDGCLEAFALPGGLRPSGTGEHEQPVGPRLTSPELDPGTTAELFDRLRAGGAALRRRSVADRIDALGAAAERLLDPEDSIRIEALRVLPGNAGLGEAAAAEVLDRMAADWTRERLRGLVESEFPAGELEPGFGAERHDPAGRPVRRSASAPALALTICSGTVPGVSTTAAVRSLLVGAGTLVKPGAGDVVLPLAFAHALRAVDPAAADALAVVYWPGGDAALEDAALAAADRVVVYGSDPTIRSVRARAGAGAELVEYRHRVGMLVVGVARTSDAELDGLASDVADAVVPYEQRGCVSPVRVHAIGTAEDARRFGARLAAEMERRERAMPGSRSPEEASAAQQLAGSLELRRAAGQSVDLWVGRGWAVALDPDGQPVAGGRFVMVSPTDSAERVAAELRRWRGRLQSVGTAGLDADAEQLIARSAAEAGASRVGPARSTAYPPPWWIHDGRGPLGALVDLVEWERTD